MRSKHYTLHLTIYHGIHIHTIYPFYYISEWPDKTFKLTQEGMYPITIQEISIKCLGLHKEMTMNLTMIKELITKDIPQTIKYRLHKLIPFLQNRCWRIFLQCKRICFLQCFSFSKTSALTTSKCKAVPPSARKFGF